MKSHAHNDVNNNYEGSRPAAPRIDMSGNGATDYCLNVTNVVRICYSIQKCTSPCQCFMRIWTHFLLDTWHCPTGQSSDGVGPDAGGSLMLSWCWRYPRLAVIRSVHDVSSPRHHHGHYRHDSLLCQHWDQPDQATELLAAQTAEHGREDKPQETPWKDWNVS